MDFIFQRNKTSKTQSPRKTVKTGREGEIRLNEEQNNYLPRCGRNEESYYQVLGTGEEIPLDMRCCDFHLSAVVKKRYLVKTEEDQSPEDWIMSTDPPHWWRNVAPPLLKL